jgi:hypothetical protein
MLSRFSHFLLYLYNGTGYKYSENGAEFKDLSITATNHSLNYNTFPTNALF